VITTIEGITQWLKVNHKANQGINCGRLRKYSRGIKVEGIIRKLKECAHTGSRLKESLVGLRSVLKRVKECTHVGPRLMKSLKLK
jgi:hypothetical protein